MGIRVIVLVFLVVALCIYAWKDWFRSLCGLILMMAFIGHEDMPTAVMGIQGLNLWNLLFINIFMGWLIARSQEGLQWDMPNYISIILLLYLGVIIVGVMRALSNPNTLRLYTTTDVISEELINTLKWIFPGVFLYDGCRTRNRLIIALGSLLLLYFLVAIQVFKYMPLSVLADQDLLERVRNRYLRRGLGYSAPDVSVMLAGGCWGVISAVQLITKRFYKVLMLGAVGIIIFGQALTGGRMGYVTLGILGISLSLLKWRKLLVVFPVIIILLPILFPGPTARMLTGFGQTDESGQESVDDAAVTSGRTRMWPYVIDKIKESPWIGFGRRAMLRTGLSEYVGIELGDNTWPHPHCMYLESLLDNGIIGSVPFFLFWVVMLVKAVRMFLSQNRLYSAVGGLCLSLAVSSFFAGLGGQHIYAQEHTLGIWASAFLLLRVDVEEKNAKDASQITGYSDANSALRSMV